MLGSGKSIEGFASGGTRSIDVGESPLTRLRRATAIDHQRLEAMPAQARLLAEDYTVAEYRATLERLYGFYAEFALALQRRPHGTAFGAEIESRSHLLAADARSAGIIQCDLEIAPRCRDLPPIDTIDELLGANYVFAGAQLGGRVIYRHLARRFADRPEVTLRFFAGDGEQTSERWRRCGDLINTRTADVDALCVAACAAFAALAAWIAPLSQVRAEEAP